MGLHDAGIGEGQEQEFQTIDVFITLQNPMRRREMFLENLKLKLEITIRRPSILLLAPIVVSPEFRKLPEKAGNDQGVLQKPLGFFRRSGIHVMHGGKLRKGGKKARHLSLSHSDSRICPMVFGIRRWRGMQRFPAEQRPAVRIL